MIERDKERVMNYCLAKEKNSHGLSRTNADRIQIDSHYPHFTRSRGEKASQFTFRAFLVPEQLHLNKLAFTRSLKLEPVRYG
jgi:hypothetical protein